MRHRRRDAGAQWPPDSAGDSGHPLQDHTGTAGDAAATTAFHAHLSPDSDENNSSVEMREAIVAKYARHVQREAKALLRDDEAIWPCRLSLSALGALVIWLLVGVFVYTVVSRDTINGGYSSLLRSPADAKTGEASVGNGRDVPDREALPEGCRGHHCLMDGGSEAFGAILGAHNGVFGFSNCYADTCISLLENHVDVSMEAAGVPFVGGADGDAPSSDAPAAKHTVVTGMKWQCVEYARRYWVLQGQPVPAAFGSVEGAANIWDDLTDVTLIDGSKTPLLKYGNGLAVGNGGSRPREGDLLIYSRDIGADGKPQHFPYGHVAVIVKVDEKAGRVFLAEQNWSSQPWPGPFHNYSRTLRMSVADPAAPKRAGQPGAGKHGPHTAYTIHDPFHTPLGWVRYAKYDD